MAARKYPMNHRDGAEERPAPEPELFPWDKDSMIDELHARANKLMAEMDELARKHRWEPSSPLPEPEPMKAGAEPFGPEPEKEAAADPEISRKPVYAGPEFDVFGNLLPEKD